MKSKYIKIGLLALIVSTSSQMFGQVKVGDNPQNVNPDAVLEIESVNKGLILPRIALTSTTSAVPMTAHVQGMKVYNTATAGDVTPGEYYNDGVKWNRVAIGIGSDGLSAYEIAVQEGFVGSEQDWLDSLVGADGSNGTDGVRGADGANGLSAYEVAVQEGFVGSEQDWLDSLVGADGPQGLQGPAGDPATNINTALTYNTTTDVLTYTNEENNNPTIDLSGLKVEPWRIIGGTTQAKLPTDNIYVTGRVAVGTNSITDFTVGGLLIIPQFHVEGDISTTGKLWTTNSVYADYVFEKYFDGTSEINDEYEFKSLDYIKEFVEENKHLPGVTKIDDLLKGENGYMFDMTELSIQQLEKIEELFLHVIEQNEQIIELKKQVEDNNNRLKALEKLLLDNSK